VNKDIREVLGRYDIPLKRFTIKSSAKIIDDKIVIKDRKGDDLDKTYSYLKSRAFDYFPDPVSLDNKYEIYPYIEDSYEPREQKAMDLIHLLSLLHSKTTFYREIDIDKNKEIYESILDNLDYLKTFSKENYNHKDIFFLGRGIDYAVAMEGSLKLKEITYIHSDAYAAGELKHGPIALIEKGTMVINIITDETLMEKTISNIIEVVTRGANTLVVTSEDVSNFNFNYVYQIPKTVKLLTPALSIIPLQVISYYICKEKGLDVDKPRNLAKSVTVE